MLFTIVKEDIFLLVIEVGFNGDAWVRFNNRTLDWPKMDPKILGASLESNPRWVKRGKIEGG